MTRIKNFLKKIKFAIHCFKNYDEVLDIVNDYSISKKNYDDLIKGYTEIREKYEIFLDLLTNINYDIDFKKIKKVKLFNGNCDDRKSIVENIYRNINEIVRGICTTPRKMFIGMEREYYIIIVEDERKNYDKE